MTECFLPPTSSPSEHRRVEHSGGLARTPSSEEISPTKFPGLYRTGEPSPPHDSLHEPPDIISDDEKEHGKKKGKFKKKEKRSEWATSYFMLKSFFCFAFSKLPGIPSVGFSVFVVISFSLNLFRYEGSELTQTHFVQYLFIFMKKTFLFCCTGTELMPRIADKHINVKPLAECW